MPVIRRGKRVLCPPSKQKKKKEKGSRGRKSKIARKWKKKPLDKRNGDPPEFWKDSGKR